MGETRIRKAKKLAEKAPEQQQRKKSLPEIGKLKLEDSSNPTVSLTTPESTINSVTNNPLFSKPSAESHTSPTDPSIVYIEIKDTEAKGQAIFATRKIQPGTLILSETPLIRLTQAQEDADKDSESIQHPSLDTAFAALSKYQQKSYLKLFDSEKSSFSPVASIYYSNCYNLTVTSSTFSTSKLSPNSSSQGGSCIGQSASRMNHSCVPNVQFSYDESTNQMLFHAIRPIPRGKEILSIYDSVYDVRAQRQRKQLMYYGFECDCEACDPKTPFWEKSDERRRGMIEARRDVRNCERVWEKSVGNEEAEVIVNAKCDEALEALERLEGLLAKEGLAGLPLADVYGSMAKWSERKGEKESVRRWLVKESEILRICLGERAEHVQMLRDKIDGWE